MQKLFAEHLRGATALGNVLQSQLFGVTASDPFLMAVVWPARAAASVDPAEALKD